MNAIITQESLNKGLQTVSRIITSRGQMPILANVLIEAHKSGVILSATNLEIGMRIEIGGKVENEGSLTIPAKNLSEFVGSLASGNVNLSFESEKLKISGGKSTANFAGIAASEFPTLPQLSTTNQISIPKKLIQQIATQIAFAAATDESRPVLTGVKFSELNAQFSVVATDGFRMSQKILSTEHLALSTDLILPAKTIQELARLVSDSKVQEVNMELVAQNNQVVFACDKTQLISRILEGNFPDINRVIPKEWKTQTTVDRQDLIKAIRAAAIFARENNNTVKLTIGNGQLRVAAQASSLGENSSELEAEIEGEGTEIAFNYKYLLDYLASTDGENIVLRMTDSLSPCTLTTEKDESYLHIIMPVRA